MSSRALRELILQAMHGSLITGLPGSNCGDENLQLAALSGAGYACGRPFLDGDVLLGAAPRPRTDWLDTPLHLETALDAAMRNAIGRAWLRDARLEHASIASFAKFTLQLLSLGAPAELVEAAQHAALDEMAHAQACFGLASRYMGGALGPGELPMPSNMLVSPLAQAAAAAVQEGCVAETIAASLAYQQLQHVRDDQARDALLQIAADETRHAGIAYRFVRWALAQGGEPVRGAVQAAFEESQQQLLAADTESESVSDVAVWHAHGRLTASEARNCSLGAWRDVIEPCARELLDTL